MIKPRWINMAGIEAQADSLRYAVMNKLGSDAEYGFENEIYLDYLISAGLLCDFEYTVKKGMDDNTLGKYDVFENKIWIFDGIRHKGRENFTVSHEMGHCVLHRPMILDYFRKNPTEEKDQNYTLVLHRDNVDGKVKRNGNKIDVIEMQANQFARYLLMPRNPFLTHYYKLIGNLNLSVDSFKYLSYIEKGERYNKCESDYLSIINVLSRTFQTSWSACGVHLKNLGYLDKDFKIVA